MKKIYIHKGALKHDQVNRPNTEYISLSDLFTLSFDGVNLSIGGGNSVDLSGLVCKCCQSSSASSGDGMIGDALLTYNVVVGYFDTSSGVFVPYVLESGQSFLINDIEVITDGDFTQHNATDLPSFTPGNYTYDTLLDATILFLEEVFPTETFIKIVGTSSFMSFQSSLKFINFLVPPQQRSLNFS